MRVQAEAVGIAAVVSQGRGRAVGADADDAVAFDQHSATLLASLKPPLAFTLPPLA